MMLTSPLVQLHPSERASALALGFADAGTALDEATFGQLDAVLDSSGRTHLLRPAQESMRRNEARLQALFDSIPDVITVLNESGEVHYQNPAVTHLLGFPTEALIGRNFFELSHPEDRLELERAYFETSQRIRPATTVRFRHRAYDGSWLPVEATLGYWQSLEMAGVILIFRATNPREFEQTDDATKPHPSVAKDRFLAMLSHELRTPLMPVLLGVTSLQQDERFVDALPTLAMILRNLELQSRLLEELEDFTALGQRKMRIRLESLDAHEAVHFVLETCQGVIEAAHIQVVLDLRAPEKFVLADASKLQQIMWNLIKNAIKFSIPGSTIQISSANDSGRLTLQFSDHGMGIEPELLPLVFEPFQQGDQTMYQRYGGLGLGMYVAKGLATAQDATLTVASEGKNHGATFRLGLRSG